MEYRNSYISPLGRILLTADEIGLTGLAFEGQKNAVQGLIRESEEKETTLFSPRRLRAAGGHLQRAAPRRTRCHQGV